MAANISYFDITSPTYTIEFVGITVQSIALPLILAIASLKLRDYFKTPSPARLTAAVIGYLYFIGQLTAVLDSYVLRYSAVYALENWVLYPTSLAYVYFQIQVLYLQCHTRGVVAGLSMRKNKDAILYFLYRLSTVLFLACVPGKWFAYSVYDPSIDGFWTDWASLMFYFEVYVVLLDVGLNLDLLRVLFSSALFKNTDPHAGGHTKNFFLVLCSIVILFDACAAYVSLQMSRLSIAPESVLRNSLGFGFLVGAFTNIHIGTGLYFLTGLVSAQRSMNSKRTSAVVRATGSSTVQRSHLSGEQSQVSQK